MTKEPRSPLLSPLSPLRLSWSSHTRGTQSLDMSRSRATGDQWVVVQETPPESPLLSPSSSARRSRTAELSPAELDAQASQLILKAFERSGGSGGGGYKPHTSRPIPTRTHTPPPSAFGKISFSSVMGLARGRSLSKPRSSSAAPAEEGRGRTRSVSPFFSRRARSPSAGRIGPLNNDTAESEYDDDEETAKEDEWSDEEDGPDEHDPETEENTAKNAQHSPVEAPSAVKWDEMEPDPFGEGVNIVIPAKTEPFFETRRTRRGHGRKASKSSIGHGGLDHPHQLPLVTGRPHFQRDRCSVRLVQGDFHASGRRYVVASDRSEESRYAIEWAISTVLRDGDELFIVTVVETDSKLDPASGAQPADRVLKLRNQQVRLTCKLTNKDADTGLVL